MIQFVRVSVFPRLLPSAFVPPFFYQIAVSNWSDSSRHNTLDANPNQEANLFKGLDSQRLLALFVAGWLLFSFPLLGLWDRDATLLGIPLFPAALFIIWALLIAISAWLMERPGPPSQDD